ncbi:MAG: alpha amylase C-terminal domain-containing protein [Cytophagales bacterium]|nr:alpha amylase C-terminal domain-containing protein [Bernardetiaceae bacterium]MDW8204940.1 alpha amylase C-terminal domain-containing protein [Cytophagales bacterium]
MQHTIYKYLRIIQQDAWLAPFSSQLAERFMRFHQTVFRLEEAYGNLYDFAGAHQKLGVHYDTEAQGWYYREWAPAAEALFLIGDFNGWHRSSHPLQKKENGIWEIFLDEKTYADKWIHGSRFKVLVKSAIGEMERIPAYIRRVIQDQTTKDFAAQVWHVPPKNNTAPTNNSVESLARRIKAGAVPLLIYEAHVGMAQEREGIGTYREFADLILPRIQQAGYNAIQLMAIAEHPYYGSFGYHVSSFFAPSSRFGTPEDLRYLIEKAHEAGLLVIMDLVHSHAVKNVLEGLNYWDGTEYQYFHAGGRGEHPDWDSKLFNYGKWEVMQFLLSNVRYWLEEFDFDGFRFDGVTSMLYLHHGHASFNSYADYFNEAVDQDAVTYLQLANWLTHQIKPWAITIAEDVSGMPGLGFPIEGGGIGFDYRLGMGIPDYWIKLLKDLPDEQWDVVQMYYTMLNRRRDERTIAYCESHDQALVGDKTIAFRLMDKEMYFSMAKNIPNLAIDRGIALHKMIRLFTIVLGGEGYLNFMGNEFGHPEWIDFPREGNNWSYKYARRQWSLADNKLLRYEYLLTFDRAMIALVKRYNLLQPGLQVHLLNEDPTNQTICFEKGGLIFVFNFHPTRSIPDYQFWVPQHGQYSLVMTSDEPEFGGHGRIDPATEFFTNEKQFISIYNTQRTAQVFERVA